MRKYLLGLLVIPFSLIAFSNSQWIQDLSSEEDCFVGTVYDGSSCSSFSLTSVDRWDFLKVYVYTEGGERIVHGTDNSFLNIGSTFNGKKVNKVEIVTCRKGSNFGPDTLKYSCVFNSNKMPVSALTPAIDGLRGTVYQIIPYVIYIGIGLLIAILGFYAIRWLVNWIGGKINSYFNSKRY